MALTKKQLDEMISELYKQVSLKQREVADAHPNNQQIWDGYEKVRTALQTAGRELVNVGGIEP